jgi:hypothetical protein
MAVTHPVVALAVEAKFREGRWGLMFWSFSTRPLWPMLAATGAGLGRGVLTIEVLTSEELQGLTTSQFGIRALLEPLHMVGVVGLGVAMEVPLGLALDRVALE